jgi:RNA polymerase sigma factor (sigma-70 family)
MPRSRLAHQLANRWLAADPAEDRPSDRELLDRYITGRDEEAFATLVRRHGRAVLTACRQVLTDPGDADDAFQATFLTLFRKARTTVWRDSLGAWLSAVAHRTAVQIRRQAQRRRTHEARAVRPQVGDPPDLSWPEVCGILHEELDRLPDRHRLPLLLCYLHGQSRDEAAKALDWSTEAVKGRLERARRALAARLVRRGVTLSAGLLVALLANSVVGGPPPRLIHSTLRAVVGATGASVTARLLGGFLMVHTGRKILIALAISAGLTALVGVGATSPNPGGERSDQEPPARSNGPDTSGPGTGANPPRAGETTVRGRAVGVDGKPLPRAKLAVLADGKVMDGGVTGPDGQFALSVPKGGHLALVPAGLGCDFAPVPPAGSAVELRAVPDQAIRGRLVDPKGRPVAGARVAAESVGVYPGNSVDPFLFAWTKRIFVNSIPTGVKHLWGVAGPLFEATTDAEGRFTISGVGVERVVGLRVSGPGLATIEEWVVNRKGFDPKPYNEPTLETDPKGFEKIRHRLLLHGPEPVLVAEADRPIRGRVTDADTDTPRAGLTVALGHDPLDPFRVELRATTDAAGRFEIRGARKAPSYTVQVASDPKTGYLAAQGRVTDAGGAGPLSVDVKVKKGVVVTGRVIDKTTGKPVAATVAVVVLDGNPHAKGYPEVGSFSWFQPESTRADGTFHVVAIPGPVLLIPQVRGGLSERMKYRAPAGDPEYPRYFETQGGSMPVSFRGHGGLMGSIDGQGFRVLEIKPGVETVEQNLSVESAAGLPVKLRDRAGKPVTGAYAAGLSPRTTWYPAIRLDTDTCSAYFLEPGTPRTMAFFDAKRNLAGSVTLTGDEKDPVVVTLNPVASMKGKLVDENGKPLTGVVVDVSYGGGAADVVHRAVPRMKPLVTDVNGAFEIGGVIPGADVFLWFPDGRWTSLPPGQPLPGFIRGTAELKPGEALDKGEITLYPKVDAEGR